MEERALLGRDRRLGVVHPALVGPVLINLLAEAFHVPPPPLSRATRKQVEVKVIVDESVMGGIVATIGDTVIDGTVRHRLDQLKEQI